MPNIKEEEKKESSSIIFSKYYPMPSGRRVKFARVIDKKGVSPYIEEMVRLANRVLPEEYDEIHEDYFLTDEVVSAEGEAYDISSQWKGHSYLVFDESGQLVAYTTGNLSIQESVTKGYSRITIVHEEYQREGIGSYLMVLLGRGLIVHGAQSLGGATEVNNIKMRCLIDALGVETHAEGRFLRYEFDKPIVEGYMGLLSSKAMHVDEVCKELEVV